MVITDVKTFVVYCYRTNFVFVKVYTDEGLTGVGEGTLEYKEYALTGAIDHLRDFLIGKDPLRIEWLTHEMYRNSYWRVGPVMMAAVSTIETLSVLMSMTCCGAAADTVFAAKAAIRGISSFFIRFKRFLRPKIRKYAKLYEINRNNTVIPAASDQNV